MLLVVLESSLQERHGTVTAGPEESYEDDQRSGAPLLRRQAERLGVLQPREEEGFRVISMWSLGA